MLSICCISRSPTSAFAPGQGGVEFQERFALLPHEHVVELALAKTSNRRQLDNMAPAGVVFLIELSEFEDVCSCGELAAQPARLASERIK
jgi:hypothetical protein